MTRWLMMSSAVFLLIAGMITSFYPDKVLETHGVPLNNTVMLLIQMMGGLYMGFAVLNWMARGVLMGGIYARPIAMGNFMHFAIVTILLSKAAAIFGVYQLATSAAVFGVFALGFGIVLFRPPVPRRPDKD